MAISAEIRRVAMEAVLVHGRLIKDAARAAGINRDTLARWLKGYRDGTYTDADLQAGIEARTSRSPTAMRPSLRSLALATVGRSGSPRSPAALLEATAPYVLHPDAPLDHFVAWVRVFAREWGL